MASTIPTAVRPPRANPRGDYIFAAGIRPPRPGLPFPAPGLAAALAALLGPGLAVIAFLAARRHPDLFERLAEVPNPTFALVPDELPVAFVLRADTGRSMLRAVPADALGQAGAAATIRGPLRLLAALADGRLDGDALFFSREIAIEGNTEAAVALRNALDNAELGGLAELVLPPGSAATLVQRLLRRGGGVLEKLHAGVARANPRAPIKLRPDRGARANPRALMKLRPDRGARRRATT